MVALGELSAVQRSQCLPRTHSLRQSENIQTKVLSGNGSKLRGKMGAFCWQLCPPEIENTKSRPESEIPNFYLKVEIPNFHLKAEIPNMDLHTKSKVNVFCHKFVL